MKERLAVFIATAFYSGFAKFAPGTFGSLVGSLLIFVFWKYGLEYQPWGLVGISLLTYVIGCVAINALPENWEHDDQRIVVDEVAGIFVSLCFIEVKMSTIILSFLLFRAFDIFKPLGIRRFDNLTSNQSVMLDDVVAGIYANVTLQILILLLPAL